MANVTIQVQSLLNTAVYDSFTVSNTANVSSVKSTIQSTTGFDPTWYELYYNGTLLSNANATLSSYGIDSNATIRTANKISDLATKELRQKAKLDLAALDRDDSGLARATYDLTTLPTQFDDNDIVNNPNLGGLVAGRPWIETVSTFTFYEAFGTTSTISTTQYVSGNKIYAESSTYDVPSYQNARIVVNDIEVANTALRGHTLVVLNSYGDVDRPAVQYDTYIDPSYLTALNSALINNAGSGDIIVLVSYDASALNSTVRSTLNTSYGSTNSNTWTAQRRSQIFIGIKV